MVDKLAYGLRVPFTRIHLLQWDDPDRGDIVTFPSPQTEELYVKRVIAIPGDLIELRSNQLIINDIPATYSHLTEIQQNKLDLSEFDQRFFTQLQETHLSSERVVQVRKTLSIHERESANFGPYRVPEGSYFVMGDNRNNSRDSRRPEVGTITRDRIMGRAHAVAFSLRTDQYYLPRAHRWFVDL